MTTMMDFQSAADCMRGILSGQNAGFSSVASDSRSIGAGDLFFALRGTNFDGHEFVSAAAERGAVAAVVDAQGASAISGSSLPLITVEDTRVALGQLAAGWRARFDIPVIAVTGSNGKTTSKEMLTHILKASFGDCVLSTQGNLNNDIGLPLTLLKLRPTHQAAVIEMGMNHPGEIAYLADLTRPTVALVTNAQRAHLAGMGSIESIAREKGSVFQYLKATGSAVFSADEPWGSLWKELSRDRRMIHFSFDREAEVQGIFQARGLCSSLTIRIQGCDDVEVNLAIPGAHNARNALGAAAAAYAAGVTPQNIRTGLCSFQGVKGRLERHTGRNGATVLDDSYNANPDSVRAGIDVLAATVGKKILVLGDMGEIGDMTGQFHDEVGGYAKSQGVDRLFALGDSSLLAAHNFGSGGQHFKKIDELIRTLSEELTPETIVLVKGSRFMRMERVVQAITSLGEGSE